MKYGICFIILIAFAFTGCKKEIISKPEVVSNTIIVGWGDDLTWGVGGDNTTYLTELAKLTGLKTYNMGELETTSTFIKDKMIADTGLHIYPTVIWAGRYRTIYQRTIVSDIADMVKSLGHKKYVILGLLNADDALERKGRENYSKIVNINKELARVYGSRFIDIRTYLISQYDPKNAGDVRDLELDVTPGSLRRDAVFLNAKGYKMVAGQVNLKIKLLRGDVPATQ